ncbi:serine/threonine-protein kinase/endoribonuclease IRE1a-like protein isoform X2, partial [Tanacetum coccineum]
SQEPVDNKRIVITTKLETFAAANGTVLMDGTWEELQDKVKRVTIIQSELDDFSALILDHRMSCCHPNIVTVHDVEYDDTHCYVALEKCPFNLETISSGKPRVNVKARFSSDTHILV